MTQQLHAINECIYFSNKVIFASSKSLVTFRLATHGKNIKCWLTLAMYRCEFSLSHFFPLGDKFTTTACQENQKKSFVMPMKAILLILQRPFFHHQFLGGYGGGIVNAIIIICRHHFPALPT